MKTFLEELARARNPYEISVSNAESIQRKQELKLKYQQLIGVRALYKNKDKEMRIVIIREATDHYVRFTYPHYTADHKGFINGTANYLSLLCGDDRLEVETDE